MQQIQLKSMFLYVMCDISVLYFFALPLVFITFKLVLGVLKLFSPNGLLRKM